MADTALTSAKEAAKQHTSLCLFEAIVRLAECSDIEADYQSDVQRIIRIAKSAESRCLARYDRALATFK